MTSIGQRARIKISGRYQQGPFWVLFFETQDRSTQLLFDADITSRARCICIQIQPGFTSISRQWAAREADAVVRRGQMGSHRHPQSLDPAVDFPKAQPDQIALEAGKTAVLRHAGR